MLNFVKSVCDRYAFLHAKDISEAFEYRFALSETPQKILNAFERLYSNGEYRAMCDLVCVFYDCTEQYYPVSFTFIIEYKLALRLYCGSLIKHLTAEMAELEPNFAG